MSFTSVLICFLLISDQNSVHSYSRPHHSLGSIDDNGIECTNSVDCHRNNDNSWSKSGQQIDYDYNRQQQQTQQLIDCENHQNCQTIQSQRQQLNDCHNRNDCQTYANANHGRRSHRHRPNHHNRHIPEEQSQSVSMTALQVWNCDFGANDCGIHNQYNMKSYFKLMPNTTDSVFGRTGLLYLDLAQAHSAGARLITPYFPTNGCRYGCLTIEYILCGNSIENLYLIQQDVRNYCIWQKTNDHSYRWTTSSVTIDLGRSDPRFFIEVRFDRHQNNFGFVGISDMKFSYGECERNEGNECLLNQFVGSFL